MSHFSGLAKRDKDLDKQAINLPFITNQAKFESLISLLKDKMTKGEIDYLNKKLELKEEWAKCFLKKIFCAGICTTSRVECLHKHLKSDLNSSSSLMTLFRAFRKIEQSSIMKFKEEIKRHTKNISNDVSGSYLMIELASSFPPYIIEKVKEKISKSLSYKTEKEQFEDEKW